MEKLTAKLSESILDKFSMDFLRNQVLKNAYGNDDTVIAALDPRVLLAWYLFFGLVPVGGTYYVQTGVLNVDVLVLSLVSGVVIDTLLTINNYRDIEQDRVSGKMTLIVRFGASFGRQFYLALGIVAVLLCLWFVYSGRLTWLEFIWAPCIYLYMHLMTWRSMCLIRQGEKLNSILGETSRNMLFLGILLSVALC